MAGWGKWLWGGVGWAIGGPLGGILGFALGKMAEDKNEGYTAYEDASRQTRPGDFGLSLLVLFGAVMKADDKVLKSELEYVKKFLVDQFGVEYARHRILLFREIIKQDYPLRDVCLQIKNNMDHSSRLELLHVLFGLSQADGEIHESEIEVIARIAGFLGISAKDYGSIKAMFTSEPRASYKILEIEESAADAEIKKAYRRMAAKYHPDKVAHLGEDFQKTAEAKFKKVNEAYQQIKQERGFA